MRDLLNQDRALAPATIRLATNVLGLLFGITAIIVLIYGMKTLFLDGPVGLLQISGGLGVLLAIFLIVRLQAEAVMAAQRTNDRLMILTDALSPRVATAQPAPATKKKPARKTVPAKAKSATTDPKPATDSTDT